MKPIFEIMGSIGRFIIFVFAVLQGLGSAIYGSYLMHTGATFEGVVMNNCTFILLLLAFLYADVRSKDDEKKKEAK